MSPLLLFLLPMTLYTAFLAVIHANYDTSTFASNKPFSHQRLWLERAMHVLIGAVLLYFSLYDLRIVNAVLLTFAMGPLFSLLFRIALNGFRGKVWWYMGPLLPVRTKKDSRYDGWYHTAAWTLTGRKYSNGVSQTYPIKLPFYLAVTVEAVCAFTLGALALILVS